MSSLACYMADTLGLQLFYDVNKETFTGEEGRLLLLGPWKLEFKLEVFADIVTPKECSCWVSFGPRLWGYFMVTAKEGLLLVVDAKELGINRKNYTKFAEVDWKSTMERLQPAVKGLFRWKDDQWKKMEI